MPAQHSAHSVRSIAHTEGLGAPLVIGALSSSHTSVHERRNLGQARGCRAALQHGQHGTVPQTGSAQVEPCQPARG